MAITSGDVRLWQALKAHGKLPARPRLLELGDAQWYGDVTPKEAGLDALPLTDDPRVDSFALAKEFYRLILDPRERVVVDGNGPRQVVVADLNQPLDPDVFGGPFEVVVNTGTFEHVFDQAQVFRTAHDWCAAGGLMVHSLPVRGWEEHGFYTYQPNLIAAIATANRYVVEGWDVNELRPGSVLLSVAWRKPAGRPPFVTPQQTNQRY